jgi:multiple sugar transport system substrate-binding protein
MFTQGKAVFHRNWPYAWEIANDPARSKVAGKVGIVPLPAFSGHQSAATLGGWQLGISRFSRNTRLAWQFVDFMTSSETQKRIALYTGRAPALGAPSRPEILKRIRSFVAIRDPSAGGAAPGDTGLPAAFNIMQRYFSSAIAIPDSTSISSPGRRRGYGPRLGLAAPGWPIASTSRRRAFCCRAWFSSLSFPSTRLSSPFA